MKIERIKKLAGLVMLGALLSLNGCWLSPKGYDVFTCGSGDFHAAHLRVIEVGLGVDAVAVGAGRVIAFDDVRLVYKFVKSDSDGKHYEHVYKDGDKVELVLKNGKGTFLVNGVEKAVVFYSRDDDGSKLDKNAQTQYKACGPIIESEPNSSN